MSEPCSICSKAVIDGDAVYSITGNHYDCEFPNGQKSPLHHFKAAEQRLDAALSSFGFKPKRQQARLGEGLPSKKLKALIVESAKLQFGSSDVGEVRLFLPPPVWRQYRFDVVRVEGSVMIDGDSLSFHAWNSVGDLVKYRQLRFNDERPIADLAPVPGSRRTRSRTPDARVETPSQAAPSHGRGSATSTT